MSLEQKFTRLGTDNAPGQEGRQPVQEIKRLMIGDPIAGRIVDFSHGDIDAHEPTPGAHAAYAAGQARGGAQAYTEYRGAADLRDLLAGRLARFTGAAVDGRDGLIITPGTQGALFLAMGACVGRGDRVAIVQPDYFANRKMVEFFDGEMVPVRLDYLSADDSCAGLDLAGLEAAFRSGVKVFLFSNPNNPAGVVYSAAEIGRIADLARQHGVTLIVDQLYARLCYSGVTYTHMAAVAAGHDNLITILGPSKTESLSGYRLGVAFGAPDLIQRMERLQAIVSLRAAGYSQAVLQTWFDEPEGWMAQRIARHQAIRDDLLAMLRACDGVLARTPQAGSYLFPQLPALKVAPRDFIRLLRVQAGVIVTPGTEFSPQGAQSLRLNFSQDHAAAVAAVQRLVQMIDRYRA